MFETTNLGKETLNDTWTWVSSTCSANTAKIRRVSNQEPDLAFWEDSPRETHTSSISPTGLSHLYLHLILKQHHF